MAKNPTSLPLNIILKQRSAKGVYIILKEIRTNCLVTICNLRVFKESLIYTRLAGLMKIPDQMPLEMYSILADKAFSTTQEVMTPYKGHPTTLTPAQRKFNRHLNSKRQVHSNLCSTLCFILGQNVTLNLICTNIKGR